MRIKNRLYISAGVSIVLVVVLVSLVLVTSGRIAEGNKKHELADYVYKDISELDLVTYDYLLHREKRMEQQWNSKYNSLAVVLEEAAAEGTELPESIRADYTSLDGLFSQITANSEKIQGLIQEGASQKEIDAATGLEERLVAQLLITSHSIFTGASRLAEGAQAEAIEAQRLAANLTLILMIVLGITVTTSSLLVARSISKPLDKLTKGAEIIGKGDLEHRVKVKSKDELGELATAFNQMTENLSQDITERKRAEEELRKHRGHLEELVEERTAELQQEVTERKRAEEEIKAQKKFTDNAIDSLPDTFYIFDAESGKGIQWNKTLNEISGYDYKEMSEYPPLHFYPPEEHHLIEEAVKTTLEKGRAIVAVNYIIADGTRIPFEYSLVLIKDVEGKPCICAIGRDITVRKRAEEDVKKYAEQLEQANIRLQEMDRLKSVFLASMSHELRTPLNSVIGFTGIILQGMSGEVNQEQRKQLTMVKSSAAHLLSLINDILDISKIEAGKVELSLGEFRLGDVVREVVEPLSLTASEKGLEVLTEVPEGIALFSDRRRVKQVLMNLVSNAVKFTDQGRVKITARVQGDDNLEVRVIDTGIGIKQEDMDKLFQPFQQIDTSLTKSREGTGLGLYLAKKLADLLGGNISAKSEHGRGSEFSFTIPLKYEEVSRNDRAGRRLARKSTPLRQTAADLGA